MTIGILCIGRPTFDVGFARDLASRAFELLSGRDDRLLGSADLAMSEADVLGMAHAWSVDELDALVVVQASFADSTLVASAASTTSAPLVLWGAPEERTGGRLRRNSLCGINLAAFRLAQLGRDYRFVYSDPDATGAQAALTEAIERPPATPMAPSRSPAEVHQSATTDIVERLGQANIGVIGDHPDGFEPCAYDAATAHETTGVTIERIRLDELFATANAVANTEVEAISLDLGRRMDLDSIGSIEASVRLHAALEELRLEREWSAVATRCWPECFTEFGGAACTAQSLLNSTSGVPAMCEADAYGAITSLMLQWSTGSASFMADLVDIDIESDTAVLWHCGLAPFEMADTSERPRGIVHTNRGLPLLNQFGLKPGQVTIARLSQSRGHTRLVVGLAEMLRAPRPFSGTAGTVRFSRPVSDVLATIMTEGLEHHYGVAYGDVTDQLRSAAAELGIPTLDL